MRLTLSLVCRVGGRIILFFAAASLRAADAPLFPTPLHLVRRVEDPIAQRTSQIDEFCTGNKIVSVDGFTTVIADYDRQEVLQIDRARSTYSVARFDEIAAANALTKPPAYATIQSASRWKTTALGANSFAITGEGMKVDLSVDRRYPLSRNAFDALTGAAYPNEADARHLAVAAAAATADAYAIPIEQSITIEADHGRKLTIRNTIVSITNELPPPELLAIPAGAKLVPSRAARLRKSLDELKDAPPHP